MEEKFVPGHNMVSYFMQPSRSPNQPCALFVSAHSLLLNHPASLYAATHKYHPDRYTWLQSYQEEKQGLRDHSVYTVINREDYQRLRHKRNAPRAIPTMAYLGVKRDGNYNSHRAKSRIVVLINNADCAFKKSQSFDPVLSYSSLQILTSKATKKIRILQQGKLKNAFCNDLLPDDKITIVRPPLGDPNSSPNDF